MKILILGGDGFCGWPTSLHLSAHGHSVVIVDNLARRGADIELGIESLTPIRPIPERLEVWNALSENPISFEMCDISTEYDRLLSILERERPEAIIHFAEQRAAPYSMKSSWHKRYTVNNNINATNNILAAIVEVCPKAHLVHLGTMGVYGYSDSVFEIPEGYLRIKIEKAGKLQEKEILHPTDPGSIYHMTKAQDQLLFAFYNKNDRVKVTDLHQGIVWGTQTSETRLDERLINRFDYDGDYGTVLNRFLVQAALGHPLTVHGSGGQTRAFINIQDTVRCIQLAIESPPHDDQRVRILNQMTQTHRIQELATLVSQITGAKIRNMPNPRQEAGENELGVRNDTLLGLGLKATKLAPGLLLEMVEVAVKYRDRCDLSKIPCESYWNTDTRMRAEQGPET